MRVEPFWGRRTRGVSLGRGVDEAAVPAEVFFVGNIVQTAFSQLGGEPTLSLNCRGSFAKRPGNNCS